MKLGIGLSLSSSRSARPIPSASLLAWIRADYATPGGGPFSTAPNIATPGTYDFSQGTGGLQPTATTMGNQTAMRFANGKTLKCTTRFLGGLSACTFFIVHNSATDAENNGGIFGSGNSGAIELIDLGAASKRIRVNGTTVSDAGWSAATSTVNSVVFDGSAAGGSATAYKNGTALGAAVTALGATLTTPLSFHQIGSYFDTFYSDTTVPELVVYSRAMAAAERLDVERYLGSRYGIAVA